ncbi:MULTISPECIES: zinc-dependent alcohol dehydrogenase family protein [Prauserella salsuginis group]|uniref:Zinc-dependent alcohol dehydrogenase family protein n=1 Tax=Prauserella salsuginis TaxID=387889 RepID=A0ABW6G1U1_9PSEU|nr:MULTISPECIES: zinc-dependent alcohol dehydrogenase family protein [Prauserella salsuginis group]MCR3721636.1 alcohol dehydrogenase [Prauserella flava]MCR3734328.1 alcohol dehydrogenase [Prauserella salsuginis]
MQAVVYAGYGEPPVLTDVPEPECPSDGVVVAVRATGVCRSDWHAWKGHEQVPLPQIPGHELAGVVTEVGVDVTRWQPGARVTVPFVCGCGRCEYCAAGEAQVCPHQTQPGFTGPGSYAERVALHAADLNLVPLPETVGFTAAASLGCRVATAFRAVMVHGRVGPGDWLAVHGCGGVGLSAVQIGVALGARVVAVDVADSPLDNARRLGAQAVVNSAGSDAPETAAAVRELTGGGAHASMDAFGSAGTCISSVRSLRRRGRHVQVGLLFGEAATPPIPMDVVTAQELEVHGSHGMPARDYPQLLAMLADGTLRPEELIGETIGLRQAPAALEAMDEPTAGTGAGMTVVELPG